MCLRYNFKLSSALSLVERHLGDTTRSATYRLNSMSMLMDSLDLQISGKRLPLPDELVGNDVANVLPVGSKVLFN